ncbi:MAG: hypothetical protein ACRDPR_14780 [Nocardioidaceae bacterium]
MRSFLSFVALLLASLLTTVALVAYTAHETVLDPDRVGEVMSQGLSEDGLRERVLNRVVPGYASLPSAYREEVGRLAASQPVESALDEVEVDSRGQADLGPMRSELARTLDEGGYPELASRVQAADGRDTLRLPEGVWEPYTEARDTSWLVATRAALGASVLFLLSVVVAANRRAAVRGVGLVLLLSGGAALLLFRLLPEAARLVSDDPWVGTAADVASSGTTTTVLAPLMPVAVLGVALLLGSFLVPRRR